MQRRLDNLSALGIPTEFHAYDGLPHGFGLGTGTVAEGWIDDAVRFWQRQTGTSGIRQAEAVRHRPSGIHSTDGVKLTKPKKGINIINNKKVIL